MDFISSSSLNVLTRRVPPGRAGGRGGRGGKRAHKQASAGLLLLDGSNYDVGPPRLSARPLRHRPFVSRLLMCCGLLIFPPSVTLGRVWWGGGDRPGQTQTSVLCVLSGASVICAQLSQQPEPGPSRRPPANQQPGWLALDRDSHASTPLPVALQLPVSFWFCDWVIRALKQTRYSYCITQL